MSRKKWTSEKILKRLQNNKSKKTYWDNICALHRRPTKEVFKKAIELTNSHFKKEKRIGIDILAQLGFNPRPYKKETIKRYFEILEEENGAKILRSLFYAIGHNNENLSPSQISKLVKFKNHNKTKLRHALVFALLGLENKKAINTLIELMEDNISSIRDWATFGIGSQIEISNKEIIKALWKRVEDEHQETKLEAIAGLAIRKEKKVKEIIIIELEKGEFGIMLLDAIEKLNDKDFLPYLQQNLHLAMKEKSTNEIWIQDLKACMKRIK